MAGISRRDWFKVAGGGALSLLLEPTVDAASAAANRADYVFSPGREKPLIELHPDKSVQIASFTKLDTGLAVFRQIENGNIVLSDKLPITDRAISSTMKGNHSSRITQPITIEDAIKLTVACSYNDVAYALAQYVSGHPRNRDFVLRAGQQPGTEEAFLLFMEPLGRTGTQLYNASGLPPHDTDRPHTGFNTSTMKDLAKLCTHIVTKYGEFLKPLSTREIEVAGSVRYNTNPLVAKGGVYGLKTGHSWTAGYNLIAAARRMIGKKEYEVIAISTGHETAQARYDHLTNLVENGFRKLAQELRQEFDAKRKMMETPCGPGNPEKELCLPSPQLHIPAVLDLQY